MPAKIESKSAPKKPGNANPKVTPKPEVKGKGKPSPAKITPLPKGKPTEREEGKGGGEKEQVKKIPKQDYSFKRLYPEGHEEAEICKISLGTAITEERMKIILGWEEVGDNASVFDFKDYNGRKIILRNNLGNRSFDLELAKQRSQDILNRNFHFNGQGMILASKGYEAKIFDEEGNPTGDIELCGHLIDGQHRGVGLIWACQSWKDPKNSHWRKKEYWPDGSPVLETLLIKGIEAEPELLQTLDETRARDIKDVLYTSGMMGSQKMSKDDILDLSVMGEQAINLLWNRTGCNKDIFTPYLTNTEAGSFFRRHSTLNQCLKFIKEQNKGDAKNKPLLSYNVSPGRCAGLMYLMVCSESNGETYRAGKGVESISDRNEKKLVFNLDLAKEFWTEVVQSTQDKGKLKALRWIYRPINVVRNKTSRKGHIGIATIKDRENGSSGLERESLLIAAWNDFLKKGKFDPQVPKDTSFDLESWVPDCKPLKNKEEDLKVKVLSTSPDWFYFDYVLTFLDDGSVETVVFQSHPSIGGIDIDQDVEEKKREGIREEIKKTKAEQEAKERENKSKAKIKEQKSREAEREKARKGLEEDRKKRKDTSLPKPSTGGQEKDQREHLRASNPGKFLLFKTMSGSYAAYEQEALTLAKLIGGGAKTRPYPGGVHKLFFEAPEFESYLNKLQSAGHEVLLAIETPEGWAISSLSEDDEPVDQGEEIEQSSDEEVQEESEEIEESSEEIYERQDGETFDSNGEIINKEQEEEVEEEVYEEDE